MKVGDLVKMDWGTYFGPQVGVFGTGIITEIYGFGDTCEVFFAKTGATRTLGCCDLETINERR